jgi:hypothetical protein
MDSPHMQRRWLSLAAAGSLLLLISRAGYKPAGAATAQPQTPETAPPDSVAANGRFEPAEPVTYVGVMQINGHSGMIAELKVAEGDSVRSRQLIALLPWKGDLEAVLLKLRPDADAATVRAGLQALLSKRYSDRFLLSLVIQESLILSIPGFLRGLAVSRAVHVIAYRATLLPLTKDPIRIAIVYLLTVAMCVFSGALAMRRLRMADPAEIF